MLKNLRKRPPDRARREQERPALFRSYALLNTVAVLGALACGAALTVVAGLKHSQSSRACQTVSARPPPPSPPFSPLFPSPTAAKPMR